MRCAGEADFRVRRGRRIERRRHWRRRRRRRRGEFAGGEGEGGGSAPFIADPNAVYVVGIESSAAAQVLVKSTQPTVAHLGYNGGSAVWLGSDGRVVHALSGDGEPLIFVTDTSGSDYNANDEVLPTPGCGSTGCENFAYGSSTFYFYICENGTTWFDASGAATALDPSEIIDAVNEPKGLLFGRHGFVFDVATQTEVPLVGPGPFAFSSVKTARASPEGFFVAYPSSSLDRFDLFDIDASGNATLLGTTVPIPPEYNSGGTGFVYTNAISKTGDALLFVTTRPLPNSTDFVFVVLNIPLVGNVTELFATDATPKPPIDQATAVLVASGRGA